MTHAIPISLFCEQKFYYERKKLSKDVEECVHFTYFGCHAYYQVNMLIRFRYTRLLGEIEDLPTPFFLLGERLTKGIFTRNSEVIKDTLGASLDPML